MRRTARALNLNVCWPTPGAQAGEAYQCKNLAEKIEFLYEKSAAKAEINIGSHQIMLQCAEGKYNRNTAIQKLLHANSIEAMDLCWGAVSTGTLLVATAQEGRSVKAHYFVLNGESQAIQQTSSGCRAVGKPY